MECCGRQCTSAAHGTVHRRRAPSQRSQRRGVNVLAFVMRRLLVYSLRGHVSGSMVGRERGVGLALVVVRVGGERWSRLVSGERGRGRLVLGVGHCVLLLFIYMRVGVGRVEMTGTVAGTPAPYMLCGRGSPHCLHGSSRGYFGVRHPRRHRHKVDLHSPNNLGSILRQGRSPV